MKKNNKTSEEEADLQSRPSISRACQERDTVLQDCIVNNAAEKTARTRRWLSERHVDDLSSGIHGNFDGTRHSSRSFFAAWFMFETNNATK